MTTDERYDAIYAALLGMKIGYTRVIFDRVVTRWREDGWETDTLYQRILDGKTAARRILNTA